MAAAWGKGAASAGVRIPESSKGAPSAKGLDCETPAASAEIIAHPIWQGVPRKAWSTRARCQSYALGR
jgi:hypothetical protein